MVRAQYKIRYNSGETFTFKTEEEWDAAIEEIAEWEPWDIDVVGNVAIIDNGDFDD